MFPAILNLKSDLICLFDGLREILRVVLAQRRGFFEDFLFAGFPLSIDLRYSPVPEPGCQNEAKKRPGKNSQDTASDESGA
jgi:hypothetical protein